MSKKNIKIKDCALINFVNMKSAEMEMVRNWRNHEDINRWMYSDRLITRAAHKSFITGLRCENKNIYWLVKKQSEGYIGVIYLNRIDVGNRNAYLGVYKAPDRYIQGAGKILIGLLKNVAFDKLRLHTLKLEVMAENKHAVKFYKRSGFKLEGRLKDFTFKGNKWQDVLVMGLTKL